MVRILSITAAFLLVTIGLLLNQPEKRQKPQTPLKNTITDMDLSITPDDVLVTRTQINLVEMPQVQIRSPLINRTVEGEMPSHSITSAVPKTSDTAGKPQYGQGSLQSHKQFSKVAPTIRSLTNAAVTDINCRIGDEETTLEALIIQAIQQGKSEQALNILLGQNADLGNISIPAEHKTTNGSVDSRILLAALVSRSDNKSASSQLRNALQKTNHKQTIVRTTTETQRYIVKTGDSLAGIAYRFYGKTSAYRGIFQANAGQLPSPDKIRAGQVLVIPVHQ